MGKNEGKEILTEEFKERSQHQTYTYIDICYMKEARSKYRLLVSFNEATAYPSRKEIKLYLQLILDNSSSIKDVNMKDKITKLLEK